MNLGGFAGGLASGYQAGEKIKLAKQELADNKDFRERGMKIQEQDAAAKELERGKDTALSDGLKKLNTDPDYGYGSFQVPDGEQTVTNADGTTSTQPKTKTVTRAPGQDSHFDTVHNIKQIALLSMRYPEKLAEHQQQIETFTKSQYGRDIAAYVFNKDPEAGARLGKQHGFDPTKSVISTDPETHHSILTTETGKKIDINAMTNMLGGADALAALTSANKDKDAVELHKSNLKKNDASIRHSDAQTDVAIPAAAARDGASAFASRQSGNLSQAKAGALGSGTAVTSKTSKEISSFINGDEMAKNNPNERMYGQLLGEQMVAASAGSKTSVSPQAAAAQGLSQYRKMVGDVRTAAKADKTFLERKGVKTAEEYVHKVLDSRARPTVLESEAVVNE